jgi:hypothetical protein
MAVGVSVNYRRTKTYFPLPSLPSTKTGVQRFSPPMSSSEDETGDKLIIIIIIIIIIILGYTLNSSVVVLMQYDVKIMRHH